MIDTAAVFAHHLLKITVANPISAVPANRPEDDLAFKLAPLEFLHHQITPYSANFHADTETLQQSLPAYFPRGVFEQLMSLTGDSGVRDLLLRNVATVPLPVGELNIDTAEDLEKTRKLYEM